MREGIGAIQRNQREEVSSMKKVQKDRTNNDAAANDTLVGSYFLTDSREGGLQGRVIGRVGEQYRVQLYSWLNGEATDQPLVTRKEMQTWAFYPTHQEWRRVGDRITEAGAREWSTPAAE